MMEPTRAFQQMLIAQGMPVEHARHHMLGGVYTHSRSRGHVLLAAVYRHPWMQPFRAVSKHTGIATTFRPEQMSWREPYEQDVGGQVVDDAIDWIGLEYALLRNHRVVATLMAIAAQSAMAGKRAPEYWEIERRWIAGESGPIVRESADRAKAAGLGG